MFELSHYQKLELHTAIIEAAGGIHAFRADRLWCKFGERKWQDASEWNVDDFLKQGGISFDKLDTDSTPLGGIGRINDYLEISSIVQSCVSNHTRDQISSALISNGFVTTDIHGMDAVIQRCLTNSYLPDVAAFVHSTDRGEHSMVLHPKNHPRLKYFVDPSLFSEIDGFLCSQNNFFVNLIHNTLDHSKSRNHPNFDDFKLSLISMLGGQNISLQYINHKPLPLSPLELSSTTESILSQAWVYWGTSKQELAESLVRTLHCVKRDLPNISQKNKNQGRSHHRETFLRQLEQLKQNQSSIRANDNTHDRTHKLLQSGSFSNLLREIAIAQAPLDNLRTLITPFYFPSTPLESFASYWREHIEPIWMGPKESIAEQTRITKARILPFLREQFERRIASFAPIRESEHILLSTIGTLSLQLESTFPNNETSIVWWRDLRALEELNQRFQQNPEVNVQDAVDELRGQSVSNWITEEFIRLLPQAQEQVQRQRLV